MANLTQTIPDSGSMPAPKTISLHEISDFMKARSADTDLLLILLIAASIIILAFCIYSGWRYMKERKQALLPLGWVTSPPQIYQTLELMLEQNSTFEIQAENPMNDKKNLVRCSPYGLSPKGLIIEGYGIARQARHWLDQSLECYFRVKQGGQITFYACTARVTDVRTGSREETYLTLTLPDKLQNRQKRAFLRIKPPSDYLLGAAIWNNASMPREKAMGDISLWPKPNYLLVPGKISQFEINDISAGGVRITIPKTETADNSETFSVTENVMLLIDLLSPEDQKRIRFWIQCRVSNLGMEQNTHSLELGIQFLSWAMPKDGETINIEWLRLTRDAEVAPLGNWIVRRQLEIVRNSMPTEDWAKDAKENKSPME